MVATEESDEVLTNESDLRLRLGKIIANWLGSPNVGSYRSSKVPVVVCGRQEHTIDYIYAVQRTRLILHTIRTYA